MLQTLMINYALKGVGRLPNSVTALAIHFIRCMAKAGVEFIGVISTLKGGVSHFWSRA